MRKVLSIALLLCLSLASTAPAIIVVNDGDARILTEPAGIRDRNNGGNTDTGRLIGINTGLVDNFMVFDFPDLSPVAGQTVTGATVTLFPALGFSSSTHGSVNDLIHLSEMALPNIGWDEGTNIITGSNNFTDDGSISYANRVEYLDGSFNGTAEPWMDVNGAPVANIEGTLNQLATVNGWDVGNAPVELTFTIDQATAQNWVDDGMAGLVLSNTDDGDNLSRFNFSASGPSEVLIDFLVPSGMGGDFDGNGAYECADVDALVVEIATASNDPNFDLTNDGLVDPRDLDAWLLEAGEANIGPEAAYLLGDADLSGAVDVSDFNIWNSNKFTSTPAWCQGDFNADGFVDVSDFNFWNGNKFSFSDAEAVPEPGGLSLVLLVISASCLRRRY